MHYNSHHTEFDCFSGRAYAKEIQEIDVDTDKDYFEIDHVVRKKKVKGKWQSLIRWRGMTSRYDSWVPQSSIKAMTEDTRNRDIQ